MRVKSNVFPSGDHCKCCLKLPSVVRRRRFGGWKRRCEGAKGRSGEKQNNTATPDVHILLPSILLHLHPSFQDQNSSSITRPIGVSPRPVTCSLVKPTRLRTVALRSAGVTGVRPVSGPGVAGADDAAAPHAAAGHECGVAAGPVVAAGLVVDLRDRGRTRRRHHQRGLRAGRARRDR